MAARPSHAPCRAYSCRGIASECVHGATTSRICDIWSHIEEAACVRRRREHAAPRLLTLGDGFVNLTQKIWLLITVPFVIALAAYLVATRPLRRDLLVHQASREAQDDVLVLEAAFAKGLIEGHQDLAAMTESISASQGVVGVAVFGSHGEMLAASHGARNLDLAPLARRAIESKSAVSELHERPTTILEHAFLLRSGGNAAVVVVVRDIAYVDTLVASWTKNLLLVGLVFIVVMMLLSGPLVARIVGNPLRDVVVGVENVAAGKLDAKVPDIRRDELGRLARSFNAMTESLRSARAQVEEETASRAALEGRMRNLQTLAAAGEVAASLAHEIGSPLGVILGRTRMIAARPDTSEASRADLEIVAAQTERITRVVQRLVSVSRPPRGKIEDVEMHAVVDETLAFLAPECKKRGIVTKVTSEDSTYKIRADRDQMVQIVFNLCHNAIQAQPNGGKIEVKLARAEHADEPVLFLEVSDTGPGIDPSVRGKIFDPFVTTKRAGSGLGLAIVDGMVRELGGGVEAFEGDSGGARFRVRIPLRKQERKEERRVDA
ncbi:MAG: ATP-binding protein [Polyangiales bacterium]